MTPHEKLMLIQLLQKAIKSNDIVIFDPNYDTLKSLESTCENGPCIQLNATAWEEGERCRDCNGPITDEDIDFGTATACMIHEDGPGEPATQDGFWCPSCVRGFEEERLENLEKCDA